jgi:uncharacterized protein YggT (Ycf19 family)
MLHIIFLAISLYKFNRFIIGFLDSCELHKKSIINLLYKMVERMIFLVERMNFRLRLHQTTPVMYYRTPFRVCSDSKKRVKGRNLEWNYI